MTALFFIQVFISILHVINSVPLEITLNNHRGQRFCEFSEFTGGVLWTSLTQHNCPQDIWDDVKMGVDLSKFFPIDIRYVTRDITTMHLESTQLTDGLFLQTMEFTGQNDPINNVLTFLRQMGLSTDGGFPTAFVPFNILGFDVTYEWKKGKSIFLIIDESNNYYIMASTQTKDLNELENILPIEYKDILPSNWRLEIRKATNDIINRGTNGINNKVVLVQDGIGNNFFLLSKDSCNSCQSDTESESEDSSDDLNEAESEFANVLDNKNNRNTSVTLSLDLDPLTVIGMIALLLVILMAVLYSVAWCYSHKMTSY
eukprot:337559_1